MPIVQDPGPVAILPATEPVRYAWQIFFVVLTSWVGIALIMQATVGPAISQLVMAGVVLLSSIWVFYDAHLKRVAKPLRWGLGSLMLWIVIFPWYLARRKTPQAPCPFIESEASPLARTLLFALLFFFLLGIVIAILKGPGPR